MSMCGRNKKRHSGFTLIEMVVTIVIIGILGVGISSFMSNATKGMVDTAERSQISTIALLVSERVSRSLRQALPNSIRTNTGACIEYIPIYAGTDYLSVPIALSDNTFNVAPFSNVTNGFDFSAKSLRAVVYPSSVSSIYTLSTTSTVSSKISKIRASSVANAQTIELTTNHQFPTDSPSKRLFLVEEPNMYCFENGLLYHYSNYGYNASFTTTGLKKQTVIGSRLAQGQFNYTPSTLQRNAIVTINFNVLGGSGLVQVVNQEVQIRNVP